MSLTRVDDVGKNNSEEPTSSYKKYMRTCVRNFIGRLFSKIEFYRLLIIDLDAAVKIAILYKLVLGENVTMIPTIGFNVETFTIKILH